MGELPAPWVLIAISGKIGDRFRNTVVLDCSPELKEIGVEFHWEDTFESDAPEHLEAGAYLWSGFQLGGWAEDDPIVATGGTFAPYTNDARITQLEAEKAELVEALNAICRVRVDRSDNIWAGASKCRAIADATLTRITGE